MTEEELTQARLENMLKDMQEYLKTEKIGLRPTKFLYRPSDLKELGLTQEDVLKIIKEQEHD
jgi:hypothetical protein